MPGHSRVGVRRLVDQHVKVKRHVRPQQHLGNGVRALVQRALEDRSDMGHHRVVMVTSLDEVLDVLGGPHDLAHVLGRTGLLLLLLLLACKGAEVVSVG